IEAVWPETTVTDGVLKVSIRKIRATLNDDPKTPQFIETAHRRGYRFIGRIIEEKGTRGQGARGTGGQGEPTSVSSFPSFSLSPPLSLPLPLSPSPAPIVSARYYQRGGLWGVKQRWRKWTFGCDGRWVERGR